MQHGTYLQTKKFGKPYCPPPTMKKELETFDATQSMQMELDTIDSTNNYADAS